MTDGPRWWRGGVLYEVYPWSFADSDGDGVGDLRGAIERLDHVARLGADAVWITPWFPSPMVDGGYDVADYCDIDPKLGSLDQADELIERAHALALKVVIDMVANHSSDQHPWFQEALRAGADDPARHRYVFRPGRGGVPMVSVKLRRLVLAGSRSRCGAWRGGHRRVVGLGR